MTSSRRFAIGRRLSDAPYARIYLLTIRRVDADLKCSAGPLVGERGSPSPGREMIGTDAGPDLDSLRGAAERIPWLPAWKGLRRPRDVLLGAEDRGAEKALRLIAAASADRLALELGKPAAR